MSFPRYPQYKASGVEWLGDVPEGWEVKRSDSFLSYSRAQLDPKDFQGLEVFHYSIPVVQETGTGQLEDGADIASGKQIVKKQVVLVSKLNPRKATICIAEPHNKALTLCSTEFVALEPNGCDIRYLSYLVKTEGFRQGLESKVTSVTNSHQRANPVDIYRFWNAWPVLPEQTAIAEFLDRETAKIDELVVEQRRLMELLKEKRQAVISHAVTKGLNPYAPMKPSGIEWLGDVPEHWKTRTIAKASSKITNGYVGPTRDILVESGTPYIQATHIKKGRVNFDDGYFVTPEWSKYHAKSILAEGDVLIVQTGAGTGDVGLVSCNEVGFNCHALIIVVCLENLLLGAFFAAVLQSDYGHQKLESIQTGGMHPHLNCGNVKYVEVPLPPVAEQIAIVAFLETETAKFDTLTAEAQRAIDLLQERRTALISAAVTGQIDVRQQPRN